MRASLESLWDAHAATMDVLNELKQTQGDQTNVVTAETAMLRGVKLSTDDFLCAKYAIQPFENGKPLLQSATPDQCKNIRLAAHAMVINYDLHLALNRRLLELLRRGFQVSLLEFEDKITTMQVERGRYWEQLVHPIALILMNMIDLRRTDENGKFLSAADPSVGETKRLLVTKHQKEELLDWLNQHFVDLTNGTPEAQLTDPEKTAKLYVSLFNGRMCSDE